MRRRGESLGDLGDVPDWLRTFDHAAWVDERETPPDWWAHGVPMWRLLGARKRWQAAGQAWLDERGRRADWYALTRPSVAPR
ncbi:hypothetical protein [Micromonospora sp. NPDC048169]|uniref:hypothetical protein n=1 Tax=Micromonospora sp. NPDC048169 TaxID=3154711 RepID=UPI0034062FDC